MQDSTAPDALAASRPHAEPLPVGRCAALACLLEASAPKPGNVHPGASFVDLTYFDFVASAPAISLAMEAAAAGARVGPVVLEAMRATQAVVGTNTNLGIILLLAPLARVPRNKRLIDGIGSILLDLDAEDARLVYEAIRLARPGGLGKVQEADASGPAPKDLLYAMRLASDRDLVARQYARGYEEVLDRVLPWLVEGIAAGGSLPESIVRGHVKLMSEIPDTLIARKCGADVAEESMQRAQAVLAASGGSLPLDIAALQEFDRWLRADGNRRNPGTTADLIAAGLFAALREGLIHVG